MLLSIDLGMDGNLALAFETDFSRRATTVTDGRMPEEVHRLAKEHGLESVIARVAQVHSRLPVGGTYASASASPAPCDRYEAPEVRPQADGKIVKPKRDSWRGRRDVLSVYFQDLGRRRSRQMRAAPIEDRA